MAMKIYLFSYVDQQDNTVSACVAERLEKLFDVKQLQSSLYLIKSDDDIRLLEKYLSECFGPAGRYFIVEIADQPYRQFKPIDQAIDQWMDDL